MRMVFRSVKYRHIQYPSAWIICPCRNKIKQLPSFLINRGLTMRFISRGESAEKWTSTGKKRR